MCKEGGVWKIAARRYFLNFEAPYQGGWASLKPVSGNWQTAVATEFPADAPARAVPAVSGRVRSAVSLCDGTLRAIQSRPPFDVSKAPR